MNTKLLVTGAGGFVGKGLVNRFRNADYEIVTVKYRNDDLLFSGEINKGDVITIVNLAAATRGAANFTTGYKLSILMTNALYNYILKNNITVQRIIHICSFGELHSYVQKMNQIFTNQFKPIDKITEDYKYWKSAQRKELERLYPDDKLYYVVLPFITYSDTFDDARTEFPQLRPNRTILMTRITDIYALTCSLIQNNTHRKISFPYIEAVKVCGSKGGYFAKLIVNIAAGIALLDKKRIDRALSSYWSQKLESGF
jgi:hypothetical protein